MISGKLETSGTRKRATLRTVFVRRIRSVLLALVVTPGVLLVGAPTCAEDAPSRGDKNHALQVDLDRLVRNRAIVGEFTDHFSTQSSIGSGFIGQVASLYKSSELGEGDFRAQLYAQKVRAESDANSHPEDVLYGRVRDNSDWLLDDGVWNKILIAAGQLPHPKPGDYWDGSKRVQRPVNRVEIQEVYEQLQTLIATPGSDQKDTERLIKLLETSPIKNPIVLQGLYGYLKKLPRDTPASSLFQIQSEMLSVVQKLSSAESYPEDAVISELSEQEQSAWDGALKNWQSYDDAEIRKPVGKSRSEAPELSDFESSVVRQIAEAGSGIHQFLNVANVSDGNGHFKRGETLKPDMDRQRRSFFENQMLKVYLAILYEEMKAVPSGGSELSDRLQTRAQARAQYATQAALKEMFLKANISRKAAVAIVSDLAKHLSPSVPFPDGNPWPFKLAFKDMETNGALNGLSLREGGFADAQDTPIVAPVREHSQEWKNLAAMAESRGGALKGGALPLISQGAFLGFNPIPGESVDTVTPAQAHVTYFFNRMHLYARAFEDKREWETVDEAADMVLSKFLEASNFSVQQQRDFLSSLDDGASLLSQKFSKSLKTAAEKRLKAIAGAGSSAEPATGAVTVPEQLSASAVAETTQNEAAAEIEGSVKATVEESVRKSVEENVQSSVEDSIDDALDDVGDDF